MSDLQYGNNKTRIDMLLAIIAASCMYPSPLAQWYLSLVYPCSSDQHIYIIANSKLGTKLKPSPPTQEPVLLRQVHLCELRARLPHHHGPSGGLCPVLSLPRPEQCGGSTGVLQPNRLQSLLVRRSAGVVLWRVCPRAWPVSQPGHRAPVSKLSRHQKGLCS